ncbi:MAG: TetR/AcrR family transcriptional regulator C-terminal domain-containing protein [Acidobacteriota bacterium]|nr:TetR/AcrR family transcriptional regulator C-terminal domain-containing protein [Acidobacteriota bacterium]
MSSADLPPAPRLPGRAGVGASRPRRQRALSQGAIVDAALAIIDREGLDALTMRTVAHALGTGPASLYAYVGSKEQLVELVVERVIGEVRIGGEPDPARWSEQIKETAREMRRVFASHGDLARASFGRIPVGENALRGGEWMMAVMRAGGLSDRVTALAVDLLSLYVMGVAYEDGLARGTDPEQALDFIDQLRTYFASLPADRFPNFVALADEATAGDENSRFEFGLEVLVRGLEAVSAQG